MEKGKEIDQISFWLDHKIDYVNRVILFKTTEGSDDTDTHSRDFIFQALHALESVSLEPIRIVMSNGGGSVTAGLAIYDVIQHCRCHVTIDVLEECSSMATVILQAADTRRAYKHAHLMVHRGKSAYPENDVESIENWLKLDKYLDGKCYDIYLSRIKQKKPKFTRVKLEEMFKQDRIILPKEAIELGLLDEVIEDV